MVTDDGSCTRLFSLPTLLLFLPGDSDDFGPFLNTTTCEALEKERGQGPPCEKVELSATLVCISSISLVFVHTTSKQTCATAQDVQQPISVINGELRSYQLVYKMRTSSNTLAHRTARVLIKCDGRLG